MNKHFRLGVMILIVILAGLIITEHPDFVKKEYSRARVTLPNGTSLSVEVADDQDEQAVGLSFRDSLANDQGLLFINLEDPHPIFWMKDVSFPIDLLWIKDGRIVGIEENMQPENTAETRYQSTDKVDTVLEVVAGFVEKNEIKVGDELDIELQNE